LLALLAAPHASAQDVALTRGVETALTRVGPPDVEQAAITVREETGVDGATRTIACVNIELAGPVQRFEHGCAPVPDSAVEMTSADASVIIATETYACDATSVACTEHHTSSVSVGVHWTLLPVSDVCTNAFAPDAAAEA